MVVYRVEWVHNNVLAKGKGRATKDEVAFVFTVLCRNISDAQRCFQYYFRFIYSSKNKHGFTIDDGVLKMQRVQVDSRCIIAHFLLLDGMREPIYLSDPGSNLLRAHSIFGTPRDYV